MGSVRFCILVLIMWVGHAWARGQTKTGSKPVPAVQRLLDQALKLPLKERLGPLREALQRAEGLHDLDGQTIALQRIGNYFRDSGNSKSALPYFLKALPIAKSAMDKVAEGAALNNIGLAYDDLGDQDKALGFYNRALSLRSEIGDQAGEAITLTNIGMIYDARGQKERALDLYNRSLPILHKLGDKSGEAATLGNIGEVYSDLGQKRKALEYLNQALPIERESGDRIGEGATLNNIAGVYSDLGEKQKAMDSFNRALAIERDAGDQVGEATTLHNLGKVYSDLGQKDQALKLYQQALTLEAKLGNQSEQATTLDNMGSTYASLGQYEKALDFYNRVLPVEQKTGDRSGEAATLNNIGAAYSGLGHNQHALEVYQRALVIERDIEDRAEEAATLGNIGEVYSDLGQKQRALEFFDQAVSISRETSDRMGEAIALNDIGFTLENLNLATAAIAEFKLSVNVYQSLREDIKALPKGLRESFKRAHEDTYHTLAELLISHGRLAEAQEVLDLLKDDEYFRFIRSVKAEKVDLTTTETQWKAQYDALGDNLAKDASEYDDLQKLAKGKPLTAEQTARRSALNEKLADARKAFQSFLKSADAAFASADAEKERLDNLRTYSQLASIVKSMPARTAAVYTLVTKDGVRTILTLPDVTELKSGPESVITFADLSKKVQLLRTALTDPRLDPVPIASELYDILIRPLEKDLEAARVQSLMFSLDGPLRYLPLAALYDGKTHQWLCEKYPVSLFSPSNLLKMKDIPGVITAAGFGVTLDHEVNGLRFPGLTGVEGELESLQKSLGGAVFEDGRFTAEALKNELSKGDSLIHLATHFELKAGDASNSFLVLGDGKALSISDFAGWKQNVLEGVDLFVISACDTATPTGDGGEFESFARAAQENGAAAVLATLWPVNDVSTGLFMSHFYQLRKDNPSMTKTEGIRLAQMWLMTCKEEELNGLRRGNPDTIPAKPSRDLKPYKQDFKHPFAHPYYWAPFVLTGNVR